MCVLMENGSVLCLLLSYCGVEQWPARRAHNPKVGGSNPSAATNIKIINMPNMSYCRFENTARALRDCVNAIQDNEVNNLSTYEVNGLSRTTTTCYGYNIYAR